MTEPTKRITRSCRGCIKERHLANGGPYQALCAARFGGGGKHPRNVLLLIGVLLFPALAAAAMAPGKPAFGGLWIGVSREPTTKSIDEAFNSILAPVYADAFDGVYSRPGVYVNAFMPKSVIVSEGKYDFSVLEPILASVPVREHEGGVGFDLRLEGNVFPTSWRERGYLVRPREQRDAPKDVIDFSNSEAVAELSRYLSAVAEAFNRHPEIKLACIGEMSGAGTSEAKVEVIRRFASELKTAYACVVQNAQAWKELSSVPGVVRGVSGPKLAEGGCGKSGKNWPVFDCEKDGRYAGFQWGNILGEQPPFAHPATISLASIEPNEFRMVQSGIGPHNPWNTALPASRLSTPHDNINHSVAFWWLSGKPRHPERSKDFDIEPVAGIMPANVIVVYGGFGTSDWPGRMEDIQSAVKTFGFNGTGQLFPAWADEYLPDGASPDPDVCDDPPCSDPPLDDQNVTEDEDLSEDKELDENVSNDGGGQSVSPDEGETPSSKLESLGCAMAPAARWSLSYLGLLLLLLRRRARVYRPDRRHQPLSRSICN